MEYKDILKYKVTGRIQGSVGGSGTFILVLGLTPSSVCVSVQRFEELPVAFC